MLHKRFTSRKWSHNKYNASDGDLWQRWILEGGQHRRVRLRTSQSLLGCSVFTLGKTGEWSSAGGAVALIQVGFIEIAKISIGQMQTFELLFSIYTLQTDN